FDAALAAGEGKQTVAEDELAARVLPALAAGALLVKSAEVAFTVKDGRLRAGPATLDGEAGQAIVSGGYDIAADQFDIRATLSSTVHGSAASRPDLTLFVYGTPDAPQTRPDLSALASWLALRTIERETQRLDAIERGEARPAKTPPAPSGPAPAPPRAAPVPPPAKPPQPPPPAPRGVEPLPPPV